MAKKNVTLLTIKSDTEKLEKDLKQVKTHTDGLQRSMRYFAQSSAATSASMAKLETRLSKIEKRMASARGQANATTRAFDRMRRSNARMLGGLVGTTAAVYALYRALAYGVSKTISFNRELVLIQKTTKLWTQDLAQLEEQLKGIQTSRGIDRDIVGEAGGIAGRLGVTDVQHLSDLAEVGVKIAKSTDASADIAVRSLARIHALSRTSLDSINETADALVNLGNNLPVGESQILDLSVPLGAVLGRYGSDPRDILAVSAGLAVAEGHAQGAATAFTRLLNAIIQVEGEGGEAFEQLALFMGRTTKQLAEDIQTSLVDVSFDALTALKGYEPLSQTKILEDIFDVLDRRSHKYFAQLLPSLDTARDLVEDAKGQLDLEEEIRKLSFPGKVDIAWEGLKDAFFSLANEIKFVVVPTINAFEWGLRQLMNYFPTESNADKLADNDYYNSFLQALDIAKEAGRQSIAGGADGGYTAGAREAILGRISPVGWDPLNDGRLPDREMIEEVISIAELDKTLSSPEYTQIPKRPNDDWQPIAPWSRWASQQVNVNKGAQEEYDEWLEDMQRDRSYLQSRMSAYVETTPRDRVNEIIASAYAPRPSLEDAGEIVGPKQYETLEQRLKREAEELLARQRVRAYGSATPPGGGLGINATQSVAAHTAVEQRLRDDLHQERRMDRFYGSYRGGAGVSATRPEALRLEDEREAAKRREQQADLEQIRREAADERALTKMLRRGATREEISYEEDRLEIIRDYAHARATLEDENLQLALDQLARREEELRRESPAEQAREELAKEEQRYRDAISEGIINPLEDVIRGNHSVSDAFDVLLDNLAATLLEEHVIKPFRDALQYLITSALDGLMGPVGGGGGPLNALWNGITGGGGGASVGPAGGPIPGLAAGGIVRQAGLVMVGERGPELLSLPKAARVDPLPARGGEIINFNYTIYSEDDVAMERVLQRNLPSIADYTQAQLEARSRGNSSFAQTLRR